jgi:hypothetical protein
VSREELLVGIDVGTTLCKAAVVRAADGTEMTHGATRTPWTVVPTGAELPPERLLEAAVAATAAALEQAPDGPVIGVGVTSMAETGVLLDRHGRSLAPAIAWHDARGEAEAARLAVDLGSERFPDRTGLPVRPLWSIAKYAWLRANHPEAADAVRWLGVAEWVVHGLGGEQVAELSLASRTWNGGPGGRRPGHGPRRRRGCWPILFRRAPRPARPPASASRAWPGRPSPWPATTTSAPRLGPAPPGPAICSTPVAPPRRSSGRSRLWSRPTTSAGWSRLTSPSAGTSCPTARPCSGPPGPGSPSSGSSACSGSATTRPAMSSTGSRRPSRPAATAWPCGTCSATGRRSRASALIRTPRSCGGRRWRLWPSGRPSYGATSSRSPGRAGGWCWPAAGPRTRPPAR